MMGVNSLKFYLIALAVVVTSFAGAFLLPISEWIRNIWAFPGIGALLAALYQAWRDQKAFERQEELQRKQMFFNLAVTSHMANVAFDKHVEFCERYIKRMDEGLGRLFREGPTSGALSFSGELARIRADFRTWLRLEMIDKIKPFEDALAKVGADARLLESLPVGDGRSKVVERMFNVFSNVTGMKEKGGTIDETVAPERIIDHLQQVLGIRELTELRQKVVKEAIHSISRPAE